MRCGAVIPAAGSGTRFGQGDKTTLQIAGVSVLERVLRALVESASLERIVIAVSRDNQFPVLELITGLQLPVDVSTVLGGKTRTQSVRNGVDALSEAIDQVLIHDAARPLVTPGLIRETIQEASCHGAAVPGVPVTDTVKLVDGNLVRRTLDRSELVAVQTPQVFRRDWLLAAYGSLDEQFDVTDEASILERAGYPVRIVPGDPGNIKVTTPSDIPVAEALLRSREEGS